MSSDEKSHRFSLKTFGTFFAAGCFAADVADEAVGAGVELADAVVVAPPDFVAPLLLEEIVDMVVVVVDDAELAVEEIVGMFVLVDVRLAAVVVMVEVDEDEEEMRAAELDGGRFEEVDDDDDGGG